MRKHSPFRYFKTSPEIIRLVVMMYVRFPLSLRNVEDLLHERGIDISHETVRFWWNRFGPLFAAEIRKKRVSQMRAYSNWQWHLDEVFVKINGETHYLWWAVDHEGEVLECFVTKRGNKAAAKKLLIETMRKHGSPKIITTDELVSYGAVFREIGGVDRQLCGGRANNRCENSHLPFRRRERAMQNFKSCAMFQKYISYHAQIYNQFNHERHLESRQTYKKKCSAALIEWFNFCAA